MTEAGDRLRPARRCQGSDSAPRPAFVINSRHLLFCAAMLSGITGLTLLQDLRSIDWFTIGPCVIMVTWLCMVTLNVFVLLDGADIEGPASLWYPGS